MSEENDENGKSLANENDKPIFHLSDGRTIVLDLYRLKGKHIQQWANYKGNVPTDEVVNALAISTSMSIEELIELPVPDFMPIVTTFGRLMKKYSSDVMSPDPN